MIVIKSFTSSIPLCQLSFESLYVRLGSSTMGTSRKQVSNRFYFVVFNLVLIPQFSSHLNENCYTSNVTDELQWIIGDRLDDRNPSNTWLEALTEAQKSYLYQSVLSSVDESSHMICNVPLCALKIEIYCICFVYLSLPAVWKCLKYTDKWSLCMDK